MGKIKVYYFASFWIAMAFFVMSIVGQYQSEEFSPIFGLYSPIVSLLFYILAVIEETQVNLTRYNMDTAEAIKEILEILRGEDEQNKRMGSPPLNMED